MMDFRCIITVSNRSPFLILLIFSLAQCPRASGQDDGGSSLFPLSLALDNSSDTSGILDRIWLQRSFQITCCLGGKPSLGKKSDDQRIKEFTFNAVGGMRSSRSDTRRRRRQSTEVEDEIGLQSDSDDPDAGGRFPFLNLDPEAELDVATVEATCMLYTGSYKVAGALLFGSDNQGGGPNLPSVLGTQVDCECPKIRNKHLDRNCRHLPPCENGGYRAFSNKLRCVCTDPYFGERCEKICFHGKRTKSEKRIDYCNCNEVFYRGEECNRIICLNGGTDVRNECACKPGYMGSHCELLRNYTIMGGNGGFENRSDLLTRDVSGTIFSLIMIVVLVVSMYLLVKRRMQLQQRLIMQRRDDLFPRPIPIGVNGRRYPTNGRMDDVSYGFPSADDFAPFRPVLRPTVGPPPYAASMNADRPADESHDGIDLPPLPTYEDATKLPPLNIGLGADDDEDGDRDDNVAEQQQQQQQSRRSGAGDGAGLSSSSSPPPTSSSPSSLSPSSSPSRSGAADGPTSSTNCGGATRVVERAEPPVPNNDESRKNKKERKSL